MPNLRQCSKAGFEPGLTRLRVRHSTTELPRSTIVSDPAVVVMNMINVTVTASDDVESSANVEWNFQ